MLCEQYCATKTLVKKYKTIVFIIERRFDNDFRKRSTRVVRIK